MDLGLAGKVAMVAGASRGLGFAVANALAQEGAAVSISSREADRVAEAAERLSDGTGARVVSMACDVRDAAAIEAWHDRTVREFGGIDLLFTNSGGPPAGSFSHFDDRAWQEAFELLVMSAIRLCRLVIPSMERRGGGAILLSTSSSVKEPIPNLALSNVLRPSVAALSKTLATELAPKKIRVNNLVPGRIATDRLRELDEGNATRAGIAVEEQQRKVAATIPLGRYGMPYEFGRTAAFLLSDAAAYITGTTVIVDGGLVKSML